MSCYHNIRCKTCCKDKYDQSADLEIWCNWGEKQLFAMLARADDLVTTGKWFPGLRIPLDYFEIYGAECTSSLDLDYFVKHAGHELTVVNEYFKTLNKETMKPEV